MSSANHHKCTLALVQLSRDYFDRMTNSLRELLHGNSISSMTSVGKENASPTASNTNAALLSTPLRYRYRPLSPEEMEAIEVSNTVYDSFSSSAVVVM
eukprot:gene6152-7403_t